MGMTKRQNDRKTESLCCEASLVKMNDIINGNLKNDLQEILPPTLSISDAQTSSSGGLLKRFNENDLVNTNLSNTISIYTKHHKRLGGGAV